MHVVVVESPAKARTIRKYVGARYKVFATRGHVSDLPAKAGSVKPDEGFAMVYETGRRAARALGSIAAGLRDLRYRDIVRNNLDEVVRRLQEPDPRPSVPE